jgi:general secretion pathway protein K
MSARVPQQSGLALIAVLWIIVALALFASGLADTARTQVRGAEGIIDELRLRASGDAAILLALQEAAASGQPVVRLVEHRYVFEGEEVAVRIVPSGGLLNLNLASESLLADGLVTLAHIDPDHAAALAGNIARWRDFAANAGGHAATTDQYRHEPFRVIEDLLQVPGFGYDLFVILRRFLTVDLVGDGLVAPLAAPVEVLSVLARGDLAMARHIAALRDAGDPVIDMTMLEQRHMGAHAGGLLHLEARLGERNGHGRVRAASARLRPLPGGRMAPQIISVQTLPVGDWHPELQVR